MIDDNENPESGLEQEEAPSEPERAETFETDDDEDADARYALDDEDADPAPVSPAADERPAVEQNADEAEATAPRAEQAEPEQAEPEQADPEPAEEPEIPLDKIDTDALWVVRRLRAKGHEAYLTGGCVRDLLLGREPKDFDVATAAHPDEVKKVFRNCRLIGRRFRLAHVTFPGGKVIETATFRANPNDDADEEELEGDLLVERDNVFGSVEEDARRRDLTINGLFYDPIAGKVLDYVDGRTDLDKRLIRTIGDPEIRFQEDPVRIIRAIKFATRLGFDFEEKTGEAMKRHVGELVRCAPARLQEEIQRLLLSGVSEKAIALCEDFGVLEALMPELLSALDDDTFQARELSEEEQEGHRSIVRRERRAVAARAAEQARAAEEAKRAAEAPAVDAAEATEPPEAEGEAAAPDESSAPATPLESTATAEAGEPAEASAEAAASASPAPEEDEEPIEVPTHGPAPLPPADRRARMFALLRALDEVRRREAQVSSAVAFGALLLPAWETIRRSPQDEADWLETLGAAWTERLRLTRRDRETLQRLMGSTEDLRPGRRFGAPARSLVARPWFREALMLYTVVLVTEEGDLSEVASWKAIARHYGKPYRQPQMGERDPKPRRSRRRSSSGGGRSRSRRRGGGGGGGGR